MNTVLKISALAAATATIATGVPATAAVAFDTHQTGYTAPGTETFNDHRDWSRHRRYSREDYRRGYGNSYREPARTWRGNDGRYYCRKESGTTGLLIGGAAGALLGRGLDGGRDHTLGTILGAAGGALLGREIDRSDSRCR